MNYEQKYLKYKKKYTDLKIQIQKGGAFAFANNGSFAIMLNITGDTLNRINERRAALGLAPIQVLHMTLLQLHINFAHPQHRIFLDQRFIDCVTQAVRNTLDQVANPLILQSLDPTTGRGRWDFLGEGNTQFWARVYSMDQNTNTLIANFRRAFYQCINDRLTTPLIHRLRNVARTHGPGGHANPTNFDIWETTPGQELYAVNTRQYLGVQNWLPHVSVFRTRELDQPSNPNNDLYPILTNPAQTTQQKTDAINARINANTVGSGQQDVRPISHLNIRQNMRQLVISVRVPPGQNPIPDRTIPL
jgi:hypothetical protein